MNVPFVILKASSARRLRSLVAVCMVPLALWSGLPIACCYGSGHCEVLSTFLRTQHVGALSLAGSECPHCCCCCHTNCCANRAHRQPGINQTSSTPGHCNCPISGRDSAIVAKITASPMSMNHFVAIPVAQPTALPAHGGISRIACRCGSDPPPLGPDVRLERLLI